MGTLFDKEINVDIKTLKLMLKELDTARVKRRKNILDTDLRQAYIDANNHVSHIHDALEIKSAHGETLTANQQKILNILQGYRIKHLDDEPTRELFHITFFMNIVVINSYTITAYNLSFF